MSSGFNSGCARKHNTHGPSERERVRLAAAVALALRPMLHDNPHARGRAALSAVRLRRGRLTRTPNEKGQPACARY
jgi:hypothetical protein